jgi:hypothetical protein
MSTFLQLPAACTSGSSSHTVGAAPCRRSACAAPHKARKTKSPTSTRSDLHRFRLRRARSDSTLRRGDPGLPVPAVILCPLDRDSNGPGCGRSAKRREPDPLYRPLLETRQPHRSRCRTARRSRSRNRRRTPKLVYLYAEKESPKFERAVMKFLRRYLDEKEPARVAVTCPECGAPRLLSSGAARRIDDGDAWGLLRLLVPGPPSPAVSGFGSPFCGAVTAVRARVPSCRCLRVRRCGSGARTSGS